MSPSVKDALLVDVVLAVALHLWFKKHEPKSVLSPFLVIAGLSIPSALLLLPHMRSPFQAFCVSFVALAMTLAESITVYRLSPLHPLSPYPGPWQCKVTKLWTAYIAWGGKQGQYYQTLHDKYGEIVRIGPNELSIIKADLVPNILGVSGMPKGPMFAGRRLLPSKNHDPNNSLTGVRNFRRHAELRKPWNNAFKPSSVVEYEEMLIARAEQLVSRLRELCDLQQGVDLASWINYFTLDVMGDLAFGGVYSFLRDGDKDKMIQKMRRGVFLPSVTQHVPWLQGVLLALPFIGKDNREFGRFGVEQAKKRFALSDIIKRKDLFYYLLEDIQDPAKKLPKIVSSALLAIVAGSDTTGAVLSNIVYYLLRHPEYMKRLRAEVDEAFPPSDPNETITLKSLGELPFLTAVINETLRLQPPVPSGLQRAPAIGTGGKLLSPQMYIPEGTAVVVSAYVLHRNPRYFSPSPERFWPDRWLKNDPSIVLDRSAFIPFSAGPANCPGKPLAMIELRYVTSLLVRTFDIFFDDGYDPTRWEEELLDRYVLLKGELPVKIRARKKYT